jgi:hypothetical protein
MVAQTQIDEYLQEIRDEVCSRCVECPPGGPPCAPQGKVCGVELHLDQMINSIHQVRSVCVQPYVDHNRQEVCANCAYLHSSVCPCPMDSLALLVVEAVDAVDERMRQRGEKLRAAPLAEKVTLDQIWAAYHEGAGTWTGCDWPTAVGKSRLNLNGMKAAEARAKAEICTDSKEHEDWITASHWLVQVEHHAQLAQKRAAAAVRAAEEGHWRDAVDNAEWAWSLEFTSGRPLRHAPPLAWQRLRDCIEAASMAEMSTACAT